MVGGVLQKEGEKLQDTTCINHCPNEGCLQYLNVCCAPQAALCGTHCPFLPKSELGTVSSVASLGVVPSTLWERELSLWAATSTEGERAVSDKDCTGCVPNTSHCTTPYHTILHCTTHHHTTPQITTPHCTTPHHTSPHCTAPHHTTCHHTTPHATTLHATTPHHTTPHNTTPHCTTLHATYCTP